MANRCGAKKIMDKSKIKFLILAVFLVTVFVTVKYFGLDAYLDKERLQGIVVSAGVWAPVVFILFYSAAPALMLPGLPITVAAGILFGPVWGVVYVIIGANIGATIAFLIARYLGRDWVGKMVEGTKLEKLDEEVEKQGWKIVAFTRLIPLFPFNMLNYAFGLTKIKLSHYVLTSLVCMLPGIVAYVVFSSSLLDALTGKFSKEFIIGLVLVVGVSLVPVIYKKQKGNDGKEGVE